MWALQPALILRMRERSQFLDARRCQLMLREASIPCFVHSLIERLVYDAKSEEIVPKASNESLLIAERPGFQNFDEPVDVPRVEVMQHNWESSRRVQYDAIYGQSYFPAILVVARKKFRQTREVGAVCGKNDVMNGIEFWGRVVVVIERKDSHYMRRRKIWANFGDLDFGSPSFIIEHCVAVG